MHHFTWNAFHLNHIVKNGFAQKWENASAHRERKVMEFMAVFGANSLHKLLLSVLMKIKTHRIIVFL